MLNNIIEKLNIEGDKFTILNTLDKNKILVKATQPNTKMDHIKNVISILKEYNKVSEVERELYGEVITPITLVTEMLNILPKKVWSNPNLKWLDPCNGSGIFLAFVIAGLMKGLTQYEDENLRYKHIIENMIYVGEIQPKNMFIWMMLMDPYEEFKLNIHLGDFLTYNEKFDIILGNPPYKQGLGLKFLNKAVTMSNTCLFVAPASWLIDEKNVKADFKRARDIHKDILEEVVIFNGNPVFGIGLYIPCAITYATKFKKNNGIKVIDKINEKEIIYDNINDINKFSNLTEYSSIKKKLVGLKLSDFINKKGEYYVNMSRVRGHVHEKSGNKMYKDDFYTTVTKDEVVSREIKKAVYFSFDKLEEANNFLNYIKNRFCKVLFIYL